MAAESASSERRDTAFPKALGKYVPVARLGSGGMAEVFLAVAPGPMGFNKLAVLKRLKSPYSPRTLTRATEQWSIPCP